MKEKRVSKVVNQKGEIKPGIFVRNIDAISSTDCPEEKKAFFERVIEGQPENPTLHVVKEIRTWAKGILAEKKLLPGQALEQMTLEERANSLFALTTHMIREMESGKSLDELNYLNAQIMSHYSKALLAAFEPEIVRALNSQNSNKKGRDSDAHRWKRILGDFLLPKYKRSDLGKVSFVRTFFENRSLIHLDGFDIEFEPDTDRLVSTFDNTSHYISLNEFGRQYL